jgi:ribosomal protein S18 acetylase RimI-like enzyme
LLTSIAFSKSNGRLFQNRLMISPPFSTSTGSILKHGWEKGRIFAYIVFAHHGHIISIAVDPARRRKGIGKILLERAIAHPRIRKLRAEVRVSNKGAQAFYEEMGFRVVEVVSNYYGDEDALIVEKNAQ